MPTGRTVTFLVAGVMLYMFGNQTQVGWLYVMSALLIGTLIAAFFLNLRAVNGVQIERLLNDAAHGEVYEGDTPGIQLIVKNRSRFPVVQVQLVENCPVESLAHREKRVFIPTLTASNTLVYDYNVEVYRRGVYEFPAVEIISRAPFGFFQRKVRREVETRVIVYPEVRPLKHFDLFDRQLAAQMVYLRSGFGSEVIGVRPYRSGDSPRHIHWRSVARTGQLISKEFAEETRPGLTLILDRYYPGGYAVKENAFEWAIKAAMSIADYAHGRNYPLHVVADTIDLPTPAGAVAWDGLLQYMARVEPIQQKTLPDLLTGRNLQSFVVVIIPWPDESIIEPLLALQHRGYIVLPVLMNPVSFAVGGIDSVSVSQSLMAKMEINLIFYDDTEIH